MCTGNYIEEEGAVALSQCLQRVPHLSQLDLNSECTLMCKSIDVLVGVILMCDVCVQTTTLELGERWH